MQAPDEQCKYCPKDHISTHCQAKGGRWHVGPDGTKRKNLMQILRCPINASTGYIQLTGMKQTLE